MKASSAIRGQMLILAASALIFLTTLFLLGYRTTRTEKMLESLIRQESIKTSLEIMSDFKTYSSSSEKNHTESDVEDDNAYDVPKILLIGDSITQYSFDVTKLGWGSIVANAFVRKADVINRGFAGAYQTNFFLQAHHVDCF
jgi:hypothetical protein